MLLSVMLNKLSGKNIRMLKPSAKSISQAPPLLVWVAVLLVLAALGLASWPGYKKWSESKSDFVLENTSRLKKFAQENSEDGKRVVALGNSLLFHGTLFDRDMESLARTHHVRAFSFLRIARNAGEQSHFSPLLEALWHASPDLLLIQSDLLLFVRESSVDDEDVDYRHYLKALLSGKVTHQRGKNLLENNKVEKVATNRGKRRLGKAVARFRKLQEKASVDLDEFKKLLAQARQNGVQIVILDVPRYFAVEQVRTEDKNTNRLELIRMLREELHLPWLTLPGQLSADCYRDYAHMNARGREQYSRWLLLEIDQLLSRNNLI